MSQRQPSRIGRSLHLALARMIAAADADHRAHLLARIQRLGGRRGRATAGLLRDLLAGADATPLDLGAYREAVSLSDCDHWGHWASWLRWLDDPRKADLLAAELADEVLRACPVCSELRLELLD